MYLCQKFHVLYEAKLKESLFTRPDIKKLISAAEFGGVMHELELETWASFQKVISMTSPHIQATTRYTTDNKRSIPQSLNKKTLTNRHLYGKIVLYIPLIVNLFVCLLAFLSTKLPNSEWYNIIFIRLAFRLSLFFSPFLALP